MQNEREAADNHIYRAKLSKCLDLFPGRWASLIDSQYSLANSFFYMMLSLYSNTKAAKRWNPPHQPLNGGSGCRQFIQWSYFFCGRAAKQSHYSSAYRWQIVNTDGNDEGSLHILSYLISVTRHLSYSDSHSEGCDGLIPKPRSLVPGTLNKLKGPTKISRSSSANESVTLISGSPQYDCIKHSHDFDPWWWMFLLHE